MPQQRRDNNWTLHDRWVGSGRARLSPGISWAGEVGFPFKSRPFELLRVPVLVLPIPGQDQNGTSKGAQNLDRHLKLSLGNLDRKDTGQDQLGRVSIPTLLWHHQNVGLQGLDRLFKLRGTQEFSEELQTLSRTPVRPRSFSSGNLPACDC